MAHFPIVEYDKLDDPNAKAVYDEISQELGFGMVPNVFKSMGSNTAFLTGMWTQFRDTILKGKLPRTLKEMIGVTISQANNSEYALKVHLHSLSALGISEEVLEMLPVDIEKCPLPEREKAVINFGRRVAIDPHSITQDDYEALRNKYALTMDEIFEVMATANLFSVVNRYTDAAAVEIDPI